MKTSLQRESQESADSTGCQGAERGIWREFAEIKRAGAQQREASDEWQTTFDAIKDPVMILDHEFRIVRGNTATASFFNIPLETLLGNHCYTLMHGTSGCHAGCPFANATKTKQHEESEFYDAQRDAWLLVSADPLLGGNGEVTGIVHSIKDITARKNAEAINRVEEKRLRSVIKITQQKANSLRELLDKALDEAIALSDSKLGYIYYYSEEEQEFTLHAWSKEVMQECGIANPSTVYQLDQTGLWGEAVRQRKAIIENDFHSPNPMKKGFPEGHAPLFRYMTLPVFCDGHIVAVVGVANKETNYTDLDVHQLTLMMDSIWEITERKRAEEAVRKLAGQLLTAQEAERCRIAREMHDDLTQRVAVLAIEAGKLEQEAESSAPLSGRLREIKEQLINLSQDVHALSRQLHPSILDDLGLVDAMRSECARFSQREGIAVCYTPQDIPPGIPKEVALCLYRIAQEGLRNIAKHSSAREARVSLTADDDSILLSIEDAGVGFSSRQSQGNLGIGLASMEERARLIGGEFSVRSEPGNGTLVEVWAPYAGKMP
jgi:PAS domain S-box-containing protein